MIVIPPNYDAVCTTCGYRVSFERIAERCYETLGDVDAYFGSIRELRLLTRVAEFYQRNPGVEGKIAPHFIKVFLSRDPDVVEQRLGKNLPFDQVRLPPEPEPVISTPHPDDADIIQYLKTHHFNLEAITRGTRETIERTRSAPGKVKCPKCKTGDMRLDKPTEGNEVILRLQRE